MDANRDIWAGYAWWAAGAWWRSYLFSVEPNGTSAAPQIAVLDRHRGARVPTRRAIPSSESAVFAHGGGGSDIARTAVSSGPMAFEQPAFQGGHPCA